MPESLFRASQLPIRYDPSPYGLPSLTGKCGALQAGFCLVLASLATSPYVSPKICSGGLKQAAKSY